MLFMEGGGKMTTPEVVRAASVELTDALSPYFVRTGDESSITGRRARASPLPAIGRSFDAIEFSFLAAVPTEPGLARPRREAITSWIRSVLTPSATASKSRGPAYLALLRPYPLRPELAGYSATYSKAMHFMLTGASSRFLHTALSSKLPSLTGSGKPSIDKASRPVRELLARLDRRILLQATPNPNPTLDSILRDLTELLLERDVLLSGMHMLLGSVLDAEISSASAQLPGSFLGASSLSVYGRAVDSALRSLQLTAIAAQYPLETGYPGYAVRHTPEDLPIYLNGRADLILATNSSGDLVIADIKTKSTKFSASSSHPGSDLSSALQLMLYAYALALFTERPIRHLLLIVLELHGGRLLIQSLSFQPQLLTERIFNWQATPILTSDYDTAVLHRLSSQVQLLGQAETKTEPETEDPVMDALQQRLHQLKTTSDHGKENGNTTKE